MAKTHIHIAPGKRGSLHRALGIPLNKMIPVALLREKLGGNPSPAMRKKLQFAKNARSFKHV